MVDDLGTFFLIGASVPVLANFLYQTTGSVFSKWVWSSNRIALAPGLHFNTFNVLHRKLCFLEVHGFNDIPEFLSDSELLCLMQHIYFRALSKGFKPKGFMVTEGIVEDRLSIFRTLDRLISVCGDRCKSSILVLSRRRSENKEIEDQNNIISGGCEKLGIPCVKWTTSLHLMSKASAKMQKSDLVSALKNMERYYAPWMTELEEEIKIAPKIQVPVQRNINEDSESESSEIDEEEKQNRLRSVSKIGTSIYFKNCTLTRSGVICASRKAFGLESDEIRLQNH